MARSSRYKIKSDATNPVWLMVELDNHPLELARYEFGILVMQHRSDHLTHSIVPACSNACSEPRRWTCSCSKYGCKCTTAEMQIL